MRNTKKEWLIGYILVAPFVAIYGLIFVYPTIDMFLLSFQDAPLIGAGTYVGVDNYTRLPSDRRFDTAFWNTVYFVVLTVIPGTFVALGIAMGVTRLSGRIQSLVLALFFLPYILPVSVVYRIWDWTMNFQFGIAMHVLDTLGIDRVPVFQTSTWFMPAVAFVTIWWTCGFSVLLFLAGLRAIPQDIYEAASLDNTSGWRTFRHITWPLLWPITALVLTIQLILQLKIFDQVYLFSQGGRPNDNLVMVYYIFQRAFVNNQGGRAAAIAVVLFIMVIIIAALNFQLMRMSERRK
nr:sugar ABC transporter permease [Loktanella sp. SALINAS62]